MKMMKDKDTCASYELRQCDTPLLTFRVKRDELGEITYIIEWISEERQDLLPIDLKLTPEGVGK